MTKPKRTKIHVFNVIFFHIPGLSLFRDHAVTTASPASCVSMSGSLLFMSKTLT